jgi:hypothetical protein
LLDLNHLVGANERNKREQNDMTAIRTFKAKRDDVDVSGHVITKDMQVAGTVSKTDGKTVWALDCDWCIVNAPVASAPTKATPAPTQEAAIAPAPLVGVLDPTPAPTPAPTKATKQPSLGMVSEAVFAETLKAYGERLIAGLDAKIANLFATLPKAMTIGEIESQIVARGSVRIAFQTPTPAPKTATIRTPNPPTAGTTICPAVIASGVRSGEVCEMIVATPANTFCGRHHQQETTPAPTPAIEAPKTALEIVETMPLF